MYSRRSFEELLAAARARERSDSSWLVLASVGGGLAQLAFVRWADQALARGTAVALEGSIFLVYLAVVAWLVWRLQVHQRAGAPRCPTCSALLASRSARVAVATGRCDRCGSRVVSE